MGVNGYLALANNLVLSSQNSNEIIVASDLFAPMSQLRNANIGASNSAGTRFNFIYLKNNLTYYLTHVTNQTYKKL